MQDFWQDRPPPQSLDACAAEARDWLFEAAGPLWFGPGRQPDGMFSERLDLQGQPDRSQRRIRVQARQIYVYCELGRLGWTGDWRGAVSQAVDVLISRGPRGDGFYIHRFDADGAPLDRRADLYDVAFILFALGHAARALSRPDLLSAARDLMDATVRDWTHARGGFTEGELVGPPRRQNPHMHLLEASLVLHAVSGDAFWKTQAQALLALATTRFIDPATGALTEYFAEDWTRLPTEDGALVEPGHCFEWSWLLEMADLAGLAPTGDSGQAIDLTKPADRLAAFGREHGLSEGRQVAINVVTLDGEIVDGSARLWPQTERLKVAIARWKRTGDAAEAEEAKAAYLGLRLFLQTPTVGVWRDRLQPDGAWVDEPAPASSFYHIICSLSELMGAIS
jgi:mannose-6-phosphate isomerase